jgi:predicted ATPase
MFLEPSSDIYETDEDRLVSCDDTVSLGETLRDVFERLRAGPLRP